MKEEERFVAVLSAWSVAWVHTMEAQNLVVRHVTSSCVRPRNSFGWVKK